MHKTAVYLDLDHAFGHTSYVYTGLLTLARRGLISLDLANPKKSNWQHKGFGSNLTVHVDLMTPGSSRPTVVCFDVRDRSDFYYMPALENCDLYFMRSYHQPDVDALPAEQRHKVLPFAMCYHAGTRAMMMPMLRAGLQQRGISGLPKVLTMMQYYWSLRRTKDYVLEPSQTKDPIILFQTRVWEEQDAKGEDTETLNNYRAEVVRALRSTFGDRFLGGLVPTDLQRKRYPDLLTNMSPDPHAYLELSKKPLIGIYTRGLHHSTAWKLPEYFAASTAVVAEPVRNQLRVPLEAGKHLLHFATANECVMHCEEILRNGDLQRSLRQSAFTYYLENVDPVAQVFSCLEIASQRRV